MIQYEQIQAVPEALAAAIAEDWAACAEAMQAVAVTTQPRLCYAGESGTAVTIAGDDPTALLQAMLADPNGTMLFQKLSSSAGVQWAHPVKIPFLQGLVNAGVLSQGGMDALVQLSAPTMYPHKDVTAQDCENAAKVYSLNTIWTTALNEGINQALAIGDKSAMATALQATIAVLES